MSLSEERVAGLGAKFCVRAKARFSLPGSLPLIRP